MGKTKEKAMGNKLERKFYLQLKSGETFEISELDYNHIQNRIFLGKINGYYKQREALPTSPRFEWQQQFSDISSVYCNKPENKDVTVKPVDIEKRKPRPVGDEKPEAKKEKCPHNWDDPTHWNHVTTIVGGVNRYYKQCISCNGKSQLIKKREVEIAQEKIGQTINDVPLVE
jgi:hypothetical protein